MSTKNVLRVLSGVLLGLGLLSATALILLSIYTFPPSAIFYGLAWTTIAGAATAAFSTMSALFFGVSHYAAPPDKIDENVFDAALGRAYRQNTGRPALKADELSKALDGMDITYESIERAILDMKGINPHNAQIIATSYMEEISRKKN